MEQAEAGSTAPARRAQPCRRALRARAAPGRCSACHAPDLSAHPQTNKQPTNQQSSTRIDRNELTSTRTDRQRAPNLACDAPRRSEHFPLLPIGLPLGVETPDPASDVIGDRPIAAPPSASTWPPPS
eukprot:1792824-Rhodomonas_salina.4